MGKGYPVSQLLMTTTTTETSTTYRVPSEKLTVQVSGTTSAGAGAATIVIEVSNQDVADTFMEAGTITLTLGTTETADGITICSPWASIRARVSSISGTDATVSVYVASLRY